MINTYLFIKKNRLRKKFELYKRLFLLSFDLTVLFYLLAFAGYISTVIVMDGSLLATMKSILLLSPLSTDYFGNILLMLPIVYLLQGFFQPGVLFSSAEFNLTFLPYHHRLIWLMTALERWLKAGCLFILIGFVYAFFSVSELRIVFIYILLLFLINVSMTAIQWKFFQLNTWRKLAYLIILILINLLAVTLDFVLMTAVFIGLLFIFNAISIATLMSKTDWSRITAAADFKIWNMPLVSYMTKVKFKKPSPPLMRRMGLWKKPFRYGKNTVYHRLWQLHIGKNIVYLMQVCSALLLLMIVLSFLKEWLFLLAVMIVIHVYSELMNALCKDRFANDIVSVLPWNLKEYESSFRVWAFLMSIVYFVVLTIYLVLHFDLYHLSITVLFIAVFIMLIIEGVKKQLHLIDEHYPFHERVYQGCYLVLLLIFLSAVVHMAFIYLAAIITSILIYLKLTGVKI